jgi:hypothetical protein
MVQQRVLVKGKRLPASDPGADKDRSEIRGLPVREVLRRNGKTVIHIALCVSISPRQAASQPERSSLLVVPQACADLFDCGTLQERWE